MLFVALMTFILIRVCYNVLAVNEVIKTKNKVILWLADNIRRFTFLGL